MTADPRGYYSDLGLSPTASADQIRHVYEQLSRIYHPNLNRDPGAVDKFRRIAAAYVVLGDPDRRRAYDAGATFALQAPRVEQAAAEAPRRAVPWGWLLAFSVLFVALGLLTWASTLDFKSLRPTRPQAAPADDRASSSASAVPALAPQPAVSAPAPRESVSFPAKPRTAQQGGSVAPAVSTRPAWTNYERVLQAGPPGPEPGFATQPAIPPKGAPEAATPVLAQNLPLAGPEPAASREVCGKWPANGATLLRKLPRPQHPHHLKVENGDQGSAIVKLRNAATGKAVLSFFVAKNMSVTLKDIPDGEYKVQVAHGTQMTKDCRSFVDLVAVQFPDVVSVKVKKTAKALFTDQVSFTLYAVKDGNILAENMSSAEFEKE